MIAGSQAARGHGAMLAVGAGELTVKDSKLLKSYKGKGLNP